MLSYFTYKKTFNLIRRFFFFFLLNLTVILYFVLQTMKGCILNGLQSDPQNDMYIFFFFSSSAQVYDDKKLATHYMRSRKFLFDLAALLPLDLLQIKLGTQPLLRFPRFLKVSSGHFFCSRVRNLSFFISNAKKKSSQFTN